MSEPVLSDEKETREKILFVDDDTNVLHGYKRQLRKEFRINTANSGEKGVQAIKTCGPYAVIVSDYQMPGMDGIEFLSRARGLAPDSVRMMLTGHADLQVAMEAIADGNIFRFLTKPCKSGRLAMAVEAAVEQYRLVMQKYELAESRRIEDALRQARDELEERVQDRTIELIAANELLKSEVEERKKTERDLTESRNLLRIVMNTIPHAVFWKDSSSFYMGCNTHFARLAGYTYPAQVVGKTDYDIPWNGEFANTLYQCGEKCMETNTPEFDIKERETEKGKQLLGTSMIPYHDHEGTVIGVIGTLEDVTERMRTVKSLGTDAVSDKLELSLRAISAYIAEDEMPPDNVLKLRVEVNNMAGIIRQLKNQSNEG